MPKLKTHALTMMTCAVKNMFGLVQGTSKSYMHRHHPSPRSMSRFLVDVYALRPPVLTVVDAVEAMEGEGPANGNRIKAGLLLGSTDGVAIDALCARTLGFKPQEVPMITAAVRRGIGVADTHRITVTGAGAETLSGLKLKPSRALFLYRLPEGLFRLGAFVLRFRVQIDRKACKRCGYCAEICSRDAISRSGDGAYSIDSSRCILCMCCMESCPYDAVKARFNPLINKVVHTLARLHRDLR